MLSPDEAIEEFNSLGSNADWAILTKEDDTVFSKEKRTSFQPAVLENVKAVRFNRPVPLDDLDLGMWELAADVRVYFSIKLNADGFYNGMKAEETFKMIEVFKKNIEIIRITKLKGSPQDAFTEFVRKFVTIKDLHCYLVLLLMIEPESTERKLLDVIRLCESSMKMIYMSFKVETIDDQVKEWNVLKQVLNNQDEIAYGRLVTTYVAVDSNWLNGFFSSFTRGKLIVDGHHLDVKKKGILLRESSRKYQVIAFHEDEVISADKYESIAETLDSLRPHGIYNSVRLELYENQDNIERMVALVHKLIVKSQNVTQVTVSVIEPEDKKKPLDTKSLDKHKGTVKDIANIPGGKRILQILRSRDSQRLKQMMESNAKSPFNRAKLMIVGGGGAGKTSCCRALLGKSFMKEHISTQVAEATPDISLLDSKDVNLSDIWKENATGEVNLYSKDFKTMSINISKVKSRRSVNNNAPVAVENPPTQEEDTKYRYEEKISQIIRSKPKTQEPIERQRKLTRTKPSSIFTKDFDRQAKGITSSLRNVFIAPLPDIPFMKLDQSMKRSFKKTLRRKKPVFDLEAFERRAKELKLTLWDFGGQRVFDSVHHFYLSNDGITILVINLEDWVLKKKREIETLKKWLASLMFYSPDTSVFVVGTRAKSNAVKDVGLEQISKEIDEVHIEFDEVRVVENESQKLMFFPLENSSPRVNKQYVAQLRRAIKQVLEKPPDGNVPTWKKEVPLSWLFFMYLVDKKFNVLTSLSELHLFGQEKGFSREELQQLLKFFTKAGSIVSFHERFSKLKVDSEMLDDTVLKPKWLLKNLASFLFDDVHVERFKQLRRMQGVKSLVYLLRAGFLSQKLFRIIMDMNKSTERESRFLERLCELMLVMSPVGQIAENLKVDKLKLISDKFWLLPSMNKTTVKTSVLVDALETEHTQAIQVCWYSATPQGLFERFVCSFLNHANDKEGVKFRSLSENRAILRIRSTELELQKNSMKLYTILIRSTDLAASSLALQIAKEVLVDVDNLDFEMALKADLKTRFTDPRSNIMSLQIGIPQTHVSWDCFLSHSWGQYPKYETHHTVVAIGTSLQRQGFKVWLDATELKETVAEQIVEGIDNSSSFVVFVTTKYMESAKDRNNNAGKEFNYAIKNGADTMIPVLLDKALMNPNEWKGPLGFHLGNALYIDFTTEEKIKENFAQLCARIKEKRKKV